jgi:hypothetical protein
MDKKGLEAMQVVGGAVLVLILIVVLAIVFQQQIGGAAKRFFGLGEQAQQSAEAKDTCETLLGGRKCGLAGCTDLRGPQGETFYIPFTTPPGVTKWEDCSKDTKGRFECCEKVV